MVKSDGGSHECRIVAQTRGILDFASRDDQAAVLVLDPDLAYFKTAKANGNVNVGTKLLEIKFVRYHASFFSCCRVRMAFFLSLPNAGPNGASGTEEPDAKSRTGDSLLTRNFVKGITL
jgi:hypothetical protein